MHARLHIQDLATKLAAKQPPVTEPAIPVVPVYAGTVSNACQTEITGKLTITGDFLPNSCTYIPNGPLSGPSLFLSPIENGQDIPWRLVVPTSIAPGIHQIQINVTQLTLLPGYKNGLLGRFVFTLIVLDLSPAKQVEDLAKPASPQGVLTFLSVGKDDSVNMA